jgi:hypothetical protein
MFSQTIEVIRLLYLRNWCTGLMCSQQRGHDTLITTTTCIERTTGVELTGSVPAEREASAGHECQSHSKLRATQGERMRSDFCLEFWRVIR